MSKVQASTQLPLPWRMVELDTAEGRRLKQVLTSADCMFGGDVLARHGRELLGAWSEQSVTADIAYMVLCACLVCFAGLMSGLTLGLMSMDIVELEVLRRSGSELEARQAARIIPVVKDAHFLLVTLLLCNAMAMEALPIFLDKLMSEVAAILVSVTAVLFAGEIVPQAVCSKYGLAIGSAMSIPVRLLMLLTSPISFPIAKLLDYVLGGEHASLFRRKQLKALVTLHAKDEGFGGRLTTDEIQIITGALDLTRKTAYHAMTPLDKVFMLSSDQKLDDATISTVMAAKPFSRLPVYRGNNKQDIVGVILVKELLEYVKVFPNATVASMKVRQLPRLSADTPMYDLLKLFRIGRSHMALLTQPHPESTHNSSDGTGWLGTSSTGLGASDHHGHSWRSHHHFMRVSPQLETVHEGHTPLVSQQAFAHFSFDDKHHQHQPPAPEQYSHSESLMSLSTAQSGQAVDMGSAEQRGQGKGLMSRLMDGVRMLGPQANANKAANVSQEEREAELQPMLAPDQPGMRGIGNSAMAAHNDQWDTGQSAFAASARLPFTGNQEPQGPATKPGMSNAPGDTASTGYVSSNIPPPSSMPVTAAMLDEVVAASLSRPGTRSPARSLASLHGLFIKDGAMQAVEGAGAAAIDTDRRSAQACKRKQRKKRRSKRNRAPPGSTGTTDAAYDTMELGMPQSSAGLSGVLGGSSPPPEREPSLHSNGLSSAVHRIKSSLSQLVRPGDPVDAGPFAEVAVQPVGASSVGFGSDSSSSSSSGSGGSSRDDLEDMLPVPMIAHPGEPIGIITIEDVIEELMGVEILDETDRFVDNEQSIPISPGTGLEELPQHLRAVLAVAERAKNQVLAPRPTNWLLRATATVSAGSATAQGPNQPATSVLADLAGSVWRHAFGPAQAAASKDPLAGPAGSLRPGSPPRHGMQEGSNAAGTQQGSLPPVAGMGTSSSIWAHRAGASSAGMSAQNSAALSSLGKVGELLSVPRAEIHAATVAAAVLGVPSPKTTYANWKMYERLRTGSGTLNKAARPQAPSGLAVASAATATAPNAGNAVLQ